MVRTGIDVLMEQPPPWGDGERIGLLCNHASVNRELLHSSTLLQDRFGAKLTCLFSPQHGFHAEKQDNMIESDHSVDPATGLPVFSLYGASRRPSRDMFDLIDVLLVDLQDVGTRVYTFMYTMTYCLEAAAEFGRKVVVLDRPNPIDGITIEGNILKGEYRSFVGLFPLPMRHGLTFAELARYIVDTMHLDVELEVIRMENWQRAMYFDRTGLPWVFPSPNMPTIETAVVYPGQVIWEGTTISEGRGTTLPFELTGAPYWDTAILSETLKKYRLQGCILRPVAFEPTSGKFSGQTCFGYHLHVTDRKVYKPYFTSLALLQAARQCYPEEFSYKEPPYEYEFDQVPMDLILGDQEIRIALESGQDLQEIEASWLQGLNEFQEIRHSCFLYHN